MSTTPGGRPIDGSAPPRSRFLSFYERGLCMPFLDALRGHGFEAEALVHNVPRLDLCVREIATKLVEWDADVLFCHGYKADVLGWRAARRAGVPVTAVSRGWTGDSPRASLYDAIDRVVLHAVDEVVCVSEAQAQRVRRLRVRSSRVHVIRNAIAVDRFATGGRAGARADLEGLFAARPRWLIGAAGRLSPEKGFGDLVEAAALVVGRVPDVGFVLFGEGPLRETLERRRDDLGITQSFLLPGFRSDLDALLPGFDALVLPSFTEGLPNVVLEAMAACVPVIATAVGGTPEIVRHDDTGILVPPHRPDVLAESIAGLLQDQLRRQRLARAGASFVSEHCTFAAQARSYRDLLLKMERP